MFKGPQTPVLLAWTAAAVLLGSGCSQSQPSTSTPSDSAHFEPAPEASERGSVEARLKRYLGQTEFLNVAGYHGPILARAASAESASEKGGTSARAIQESDVFKIGKPGSKLLFLLNNYRGLQVISFEKGADQPELMGRVEATGNYPDTMYFDSARDRLVVIERVYTDDEGNQTNWQEQLSRVLVYDVSNPEKPFVSQKIEFKGNAADSRLVGDVLYVATSYTPNNRWNRDESKPQGIVYSFKLGNEISLVAQKTLALPTYRENMNIVEVANVNGGFNYYLVAILSNSQWGWWWDRSSAVEVVDITSPTGAIEPVMIAPVKGQINERSSTSIKNNTLIVVSNYVSEEGQQLQRIAVETYKFPMSNSDVLTSDEVKFRKMHIERELKKLEAQGASAAELKAKRVQLESDKELGLKGKFELTAAGNKEKVMADSVVTVGDTNGQHASLQDVRFAGDLLYAFWVPANLIDPLDVFDISNPENGISHLGHLEFEGWIQRSFPLEYKGRTYILGLGTIVPSVNNEEGRRHPQARLIELKKLRNGKVKAVDVADITFKDSNVWAQLNGEDKFVELNLTNAELGQGTILFRVDQYTERKYISGGKLVAFDLSKADEGDVFTEGGLLASEWGWLRRVFTNPEIAKINTFSDEELQVFNTESAGAASEVFSAIGTLELARNVVAYVTLTVDSAVQITSRGQDYYWGQAESKAFTQLRQVSVLNGDAELKDVAASMSINGQYESHLKLGDNSLLVATRQTKEVETTVEGETVKSQVAVHTVSLVSIVNGKLAVKASTSIEVAPQVSRGHWGFERAVFRPWYNHANLSLSKMADGSVLATVGSELYAVRLESSALVELAKIATQACEMTNSASSTLVVRDGKLFMTWTVRVNEEGEVVSGEEISALGHSQAKEAPYQANYVATLSPVAGAAQPTLACANKVNVPGELFALTSGGLTLTKDNRLMDRMRKEQKYGNGESYVYYEYLTKQVLASLRPTADGKVELVDMYDPAGDGENRWSSSLDSMKALTDDRFMFVESKDYENRDTTYTFSVLSFDSTGRILKQSSLVELEMAGGAYLTQVIQGKNGLLTVVQSGRKLQVLQWETKLKRAAVQNLQRMTASGEFAEAAKVVVLPGYSWYGYGERSEVDFDANRSMLNFAQGLHGVSQVKMLAE
jgi:hypothetical protein